MSDALDQFAEGIASRLRDILLAQSRWDGFVSDPEREEAAIPPEANERLAAEMVLRAVRAGADPVNYAILRRLVDHDDGSLTALMEQTGLSRVGLTETVQDLAQVGLVSYAPENREVRATAGARGLLGLIDAVRGRVASTMRKRAK